MRTPTALAPFSRASLLRRRIASAPDEDSGQAYFVSPDGSPSFAASSQTGIPNTTNVGAALGYANGPAGERVLVSARTVGQVVIAAVPDLVAAQALNTFLSNPNVVSAATIGLTDASDDFGAFIRRVYDQDGDGDDEIGISCVGGFLGARAVGLAAVQTSSIITNQVRAAALVVFTNPGATGFRLLVREHGRCFPQRWRAGARDWCSLFRNRSRLCRCRYRYIAVNPPAALRGASAFG